MMNIEALRKRDTLVLVFKRQNGNYCRLRVPATTSQNDLDVMIAKYVRKGFKFIPENKLDLNTLREKGDDPESEKADKIKGSK